jgi:superfamily II DNA or RNA helicase
MTHVTFRPYQIAAREQMRSAFAEGVRSLLFVLPTGGGKTTVASDMILRGLERGKRSVFLAHRTELVEQAAARLAHFGVYAGVEQASRRARNSRVTVASIPTLVRRPESRLPLADLVIVDEAHHSTSNGFAKIIRHYTERGAWVVGLTATPYRLDNKPLGDFYQRLIAPVSMSDLIAHGHLVPPTYYAVDHRDLYQDVGVMAGDYKSSEAFAIADKPKLYGEVVDKYRSHADPTRPAIVFNINVEHSLKTAAALAEAGIQARHLDGETPSSDRESILRDFRAGRFPVLCNVNILTEGYDLPEIGTVIINRATKSRSLWKQMVGRGLRPAAGKTHCIVIDHGGNVWEHGFVEAPEEYTLFPEPKKSKAGESNPPVKVCPVCDAVAHLSARACADCGHEFPVGSITVDEGAELVNVTELLMRSLEVATAPQIAPEPRSREELIRTLPAHLKGRKFSEMSDEDLRQYALHMGYKPGWVYHQRKMRNRRVHT